MGKNYNENLEVNVLSILFKDASLFPVVEDILEYDSFGVSSYANIFQSFRDVVEADLYPDLETVANDLSRKGIIDRIKIHSEDISGRDALEHISSLDTSPDMIENYAYQISELRADRQLLELTEKIKKSIDNRKRPIEILSYIDVETGKISAYIGSANQNTRTSKDVAESNIQQFQDTIKGKSRYIETGLKFWDDFAGGIAPRFYLIASEQNEGKSTLVNNLIYNIAVDREEDKKVKVKLFTFESSAEEINNKLVQRQTGISQIRIEKGELSEKELSMYQEALQKISESPIIYDDSSEITLPLLRTKIRKAVADGAKIIFIDQIEQIMIGGSGDSQPEHIKINYISYRLKAYQREMDVAIVAVHQNKKLTGQGGAEHRNKVYDYQLNDLSQAGGKAPNAVVMIRTTREPAVFWVKNREGRKGKRPLGWEGKYLKMYDIPEELMDNLEEDSLPEFTKG